MTRNYWEIVDYVIHEADVVLEILDARFPELTRNQEVEDKVARQNKQLIFVMNKCDLVSQEYCRDWKRKLKNAVFVSSKLHQGTKVLRDEILKHANNEKIVVGVVGYPNVGKSSVINVLKGRASAKTSSMSGLTRALQKIKITNRIMMLDTPGVLPYHEKDRTKHTLIGAISPEHIKDAEGIAMELIDVLQGRIQQHYAVSGDDSYDVLCNIAKKMNRMRKGNEPDTETTARMLLKLWQEGKIRV